MNDFDFLVDLFDVAKGSFIGFYVIVTIVVTCSIATYHWHRKHESDAGTRIFVAALCTVGWPIVTAFGVTVALIVVVAYPWHLWKARHERRAVREQQRRRVDAGPK